MATKQQDLGIGSEEGPCSQTICPNENEAPSNLPFISKISTAIKRFLKSAGPEKSVAVETNTLAKTVEPEQGAFLVHVKLFCWSLTITATLTNNKTVSF